MRKSLVAGNWKMHGSRSSVAKLLNDISQQAAQSSLANVELTLCPPYVFLEQCANLLKQTNIAWGAQNVSSHPYGAYTGEISAAMLADFNCRYVIVGHSERRALYGETNEIVAEKCFAAFKAGIRPILCVGESLKQRESGETLEIVKQQLAAVISLSHNLPTFSELVIAYEPVWAIGTGRAATPEQAQEVHLALRNELAAHNKNLAQQVRIIYGGSVKPGNAASLFAMTDIDGALVGNASLDANEFIEIVKQCNNFY